MWIWECFLLNWGITILLAVLLAVSELLDEVPSIKSNSIHRFVYNFLKSVTNKKSKGD
jgi:uncharacterized protein YggT (Ycf19 family)